MRAFYSTSGDLEVTIDQKELCALQNGGWLSAELFIQGEEPTGKAFWLKLKLSTDQCFSFETHPKEAEALSDVMSFEVYVAQTVLAELFETQITRGKLQATDCVIRVL